jgi:site-specific recombinase XerD
VLTPKGDKIRAVPMTTRLREALQKQRETSDQKTVLVTLDGAVPHPWTVRDWLNRAQREAKRDEKGPHTLRHTFCSHLAMTGAHVMEIKTLAGHAELETTQRYMHLSPRALRGAVDRLDGSTAPVWRRRGDGNPPLGRISGDAPLACSPSRDSVPNGGCQPNGLHEN